MISEENPFAYPKTSPKKCAVRYLNETCSLKMETSRTTLAEVDTVGPALLTPTDFVESPWMMDLKYGSINLSLSTNTNSCGLFNNDLDFLNEILDNGLTTETVTSEVTAMQCDEEEPYSEQLSSSSPDSWSIDHSFSSTAALSPNNFTVSSTSDSNFDLVSSSTLVDDTSVHTTSPDVDIFSMLLGDNDVPLEDILEQMENAALKQTQSADVVRLDHDYTKKSSADVDHPCPSANIDVELECEFVAPSVPKKRKFAEVERRSRNNEASRRSRATRKEKFKMMEDDVQRLAADNQRMRVLLRDMESVAKRCKEQLVSSLGRNG